MSGIPELAECGGQFDTALSFVRQVQEHLVKESVPLGVAGVQFSSSASSPASARRPASAAKHFSQRGQSLSIRNSC